MSDDVNIPLAEEQRGNSKPWLQPYQFKKGQSGNPGGRPAGKSLKQYAREMIAAMDEEERQKFLHGIDKRTIWEMAEGKAKQDVSVEADVREHIVAADE